MGKTSQLAQERLGKSANNFGNPFENVGYVDKPKDPQERSGSIKIMSRSDTSERPYQANIQGFVIHLVKLKKINGHMPAAPEGGCKRMGGEADSPTNPERGHVEKCKRNI